MNTKKAYFKIKTQEHRRFIGCITVVIQIRKSRSISCVVMVTPWRLFVMQNNARRPLRLKSSRYIQKCQTQLYICRFTTSLCQGFLAVCVYMQMDPSNSNGSLGHLIGSVNCDVTGQSWRHQKVVSCLARISRSQTTGTCLAHPGVRDKTVSWPSYL